jgi:RsiW-degrading membrane proteinase PrsW (M82 family)
MANLPGLPISVFPVVVFLIALVFLDSYKLVSFRTVVMALLCGLGIAFVAWLINDSLIRALAWDDVHYKRYLGPLVEEALKASFIVYAIRAKRVGFMVDAAIVGFAVGAGFAIVENFYYAAECVGISLITCVLRGFGTAVMHGGATALVGIVAQSLSDRFVSVGPKVFLPAIAIAYVIHSLFNHLVVAPELSVIGIVIIIPLVIVLAFRHSERNLRSWLGVGFDTDADMLDIITRGGISRTGIGRYLESFRETLPPTAVADMLCLLRLHAELSIQAKGVLLMREAGFETEPDPEIREKLVELEFLEKSVGKTGMRALAPFLHWRTRDLWQLHMLGKK